MASELADIVAKNSGDIQELQVGESPEDFNTKFIFLNEMLSGADALTLKQKLVGSTFILDKSLIVGSGALTGSAYGYLDDQGGAWTTVF